VSAAETEDADWRVFGDVMKEQALERRAKRQEIAAIELTDRDVEILVRFSPYHLRIRVLGVRFDFWPPTGRFRRGTEQTIHTGGIRAMRALLAASQEHPI
jgi:hypothetical protein